MAEWPPTRRKATKMARRAEDRIAAGAPENRRGLQLRALWSTINQEMGGAP